MVTLNLDTFDLATSISLAEAAECLHGRNGQRPAVETVRRWTRPDRGYRSRETGEQVVLPTVRINGELRTMPAWVAWFEAMRVTMGRRDRS